MKNLLLIIIGFVLVSFSIKGQEAKIMGKVTNLNKEGISDANLVLMKDGKELDKTISDKEGSFIFSKLDIGIYLIKATHPDYEEKLGEVKVADASSKNIYISSVVLENEKDRKRFAKTSSTSNKGRIALSAEDLKGTLILGSVRTLLGKPVEKAKVRLLDESGELVKEEETNDKGMYIFKGIKAGFYTVEASHSDYESNKAEVAVENAAEGSEGGKLQARPAPPIVLENERDRAAVKDLPKEEREKLGQVKTLVIGDKPAITQRSKLQGKAIPEFSLKDIKGNTWTNETILGKPTVINFWHVGCIPCIKEMPQMNKWLDEYPDANYLTCTWNSAEVAGPIIERTPFLLNNLIDGQDLFDKLEVKLTPTTLILDKNGVIQSVVVGASDANVQRILNKVKELGR